MSRLTISRVLPYRPEQLFDLAADVESYPSFVPGWLSAEILRRDGDIYYTDQVVGFGPMRWRFASRTVLRRPTEITVTAIDGLFRRFELAWLFRPRSQDSCEVTMTGELELSTALLHGAFSRLMAGSLDAALAAFEDRAHQLYSRAVPVDASQGTGPCC
jgi:coenzyme Q-binding protein COQ10